MSYIPNVRDEFTPSFTGKNPKKPNPYYEGNLKEADKTSICYYDDAVETVDNFFNNLDVYADTLKPYINVDNIDMNKILDEELDLETLSEEELGKISKDTQIAITVRNCLLHWLEMQRNEIVVSMIDDYEAEEEFL